jgi:hypothetical protein
VNEHEFKTRFRHAVGEPPPMDVHRLEALLGARPRRRWPGAIGSIAATLVILTAGAWAGWRLVLERNIIPAAPTPSATPQPTPAAVDASHCRLPVVVRRESGPPGQVATEPGFVDTRTGTYVTDRAASIAGLPGGAFEGTDVKPAYPAAAAWYDETVGRWLPVAPPAVAPDGLSYVWTRLLPFGSNIGNLKSSELHRYDLATRTDHVLWSYPGQIMVWRWDTQGILVESNPPPPAGGQVIDWLIDPATGSASQQPPRNPFQGPTLLPGEQRNSFSWGSFGQDAEGHTLYRIGSRQAGATEWIFYESAPGQRVTIYKGTQGDAMGFDPARSLGDATGIWLSDYEWHGLWHWDSGSGLRKYAVTGQPGLLSGANSALYVDPAGPCM